MLNAALKVMVQADCFKKRFTEKRGTGQSSAFAQLRFPVHLAFVV